MVRRKTVNKFRIHPQAGFNFGELNIDNFAGGGGASTGIEEALGRPVDIAINHDQVAISMHTVTTKDRFGLVTVRGVEYQIVDIGMRMLSPRELYRAQGFPENYIIDRDADGRPITKTEQVAKCGNSVCPPIAAALIRANRHAGADAQEGAAA
jgi:site-specific DNA-cytosine methylase